MHKYFLLLTVVTLSVIALLISVSGNLKNKLANKAFVTVTNPSPPSNPSPTEDIKIMATGLEVPWALAFLPSGELLVTERVGRVRFISKEGILQEKPIATINVRQTGESGLHGIAIHPKYPNPPYIYLYYTDSADSNDSLNRVSRFTFIDNQLKDEQIIVDKIPGAIFHDGGRIKFGPDNNLYLTTGDALNPSLAQNKNSLAGKILIVKENSKAEVFSFGHRNPQGITWDSQGQLWETEHGQSAQDEINRIQIGRNYGWPTIRGDEQKDGLQSPVLHSGSQTWAPAGLAFYKNSLFFGGLRGQALFQLNIQTLSLTEHFKGQFGRIREVILGPDQMLYLTTSNRDGRGNPQSGDDKIIRVNPEKLL